MNRKRVAALLRELADEVERDNAVVLTDEPHRSRKRVAITDLDRARAKKDLRALGYKV